MVQTRTRYSLEYIQNLWDTGKDKTKLETLIRAFRGIQALDPKDPNSFSRIAGYHGEPFREKGNVTDSSDWWGGYCWHDTVLFPTWHRAYILRLENALRSIPKCEDVTLPYWDELANRGANPPRPIPAILTAPQFDLDGQSDNPLHSYILQEALLHDDDKEQRYTKDKGYQTVRYPLSGLVGTEKDRADTKLHNSKHNNQGLNTQTLNANVASWLEGTVKITPDDGQTKMPDTYSVYSRYMRSLEAPNYTVFSNTASQKQWISEHGGTPGKDHIVVSMESAHNAIHLAVGGFYQKGDLNANPIVGANGDMGDNETAAFDPIFYFHHCFCDYVFATWQQEKKLTKRGDLTVIDGYKGTILEVGQPGYKPKTVLDMNTALLPFEKPGGGYYNSHDMTDFENELGYTYAPGSLHFEIQSWHMALVGPQAPIVATKRVYNVNRTQYAGSFVVRLYARGHDGKVVEVGREPVLSRWSIEGCANCQNHLDVESFVHIDETMLKTLQGPDEKEIKWWADVQTRDQLNIWRSPSGQRSNEDQGQGGEQGPKVDDL